MTKYGIYPHYLFRHHDPILDAVDTLIQDSGMQRKEIAAASGVSPGTLRSWHLRKTRRPQFATLTAVARVFGADIALIREKRK